MDELIKAVKSLILVLPEECDEWADSGLYRMVKDRIECVEEEIAKAEQE